MRTPFVQLLLVHLREYYREPGILFWAFVFPILTALGLGMAFTQKTIQKRDVAIVCNQAAPDTSLQLILKNTPQAYVSSKKTIAYIVTIGNDSLGKTMFRLFPVSESEAKAMLRKGQTDVIVSETSKGLQYQYDPYNSNAQLAYYQLHGYVQSSGKEVRQEEIKAVTQKGSRYIDFFIPGLIAMNLMMSTMWGISYTLIERRSKKLLRRLVATPMRKSQFIISQFVARFLMNVVEASILFVFSYYFFGITIQGSVGAAFLVYSAGMFCFSGIAVLVASRTSKTYIGNGLINAVVMPMMLVCGVFFSYTNFPDAIIPYIQILPLTLLADGLRSIFIECGGFSEIALPAFVLASIGGIAFGIGLKVYKWY